MNTQPLKANKITLEYRAMLIQDALNGLYVLRNFTDDHFQYDHEDLAVFERAIVAVRELQTQLTRKYQLPRWVESPYEPAHWEHSQIK